MIPLFVFRIWLTMRSPLPGILFSVSSTPFFRSVYACAVLSPLKYFDIPPTFSEIDILLSLSTMMKLLFSLEALLSASYAMPPVSEPSPMTDTTLWSCPRSSLAAT